MSEKDLLKISDKKFKSRLMIGTGRHRSNDEMVNSIKASGAEIITVAIRRLDLKNKSEKLINLNHQYFLFIYEIIFFSHISKVCPVELVRA